MWGGVVATRLAVVSVNDPHLSSATAATSGQGEMSTATTPSSTSANAVVNGSTAASRGPEANVTSSLTFFSRHLQAALE